MNKILLIGRLTRDPELRTMPSGNAVCRFGIAVNRTFKNKDGVIEPDYFNISVYNKQGENAAKYLVKGSQVGIEGRVQIGTYDGQDGIKRTSVDVIADRVEFLGAKGGTSSGPVYVDTTSSVYNDGPSPETGVDVSNGDPFADFGSEVSITDDDLPF